MVLISATARTGTGSSPTVSWWAHDPRRRETVGAQVNQINWMNDYITTTYASPALFTYSTRGSTIGGAKLLPAADGTLVTPDHLCPDLLRWENIGAADGPRGRVARGLFWLLRGWPRGGKLRVRK